MNDRLTVNADFESGAPFKTFDEDDSKAAYFWNKKNLYTDESRVYNTSIPLWRFVTSLIFVIAFASCVSYIASLCNDGSKTISSFCLIIITIYFLWAIWWDHPYIYPPTWTFFKAQQFHPFLILLMMFYETTLLAIASFCIIAGLIFTFGDLQSIFEYDCDVNHSGFHNND